jgi:hypothetical protein
LGFHIERRQEIWQIGRHLSWKCHHIFASCRFFAGINISLALSGLLPERRRHYRVHLFVSVDIYCWYFIFGGVCLPASNWFQTFVFSKSIFDNLLSNNYNIRIYF